MVAGVVPLWYPNELVLLQHPYNICFPHLKLLFLAFSKLRHLQFLRCCDTMLSINYQEPSVTYFLPRLWPLLQEDPIFVTWIDAYCLPLVDISHLREKVLQSLNNFSLASSNYNCILLALGILGDDHSLNVHWEGLINTKGIAILAVKKKIFLCFCCLLVVNDVFGTLATGGYIGERRPWGRCRRPPPGLLPKTISVATGGFSSALL